MHFIRGLVYPNPNSGGRGTAWRMKWMYEFWGFAINGTSSPTVPGGFASPNGIGMPTDFTGGASLLASGTDGSHTAVDGSLFSGDCTFTATASAPFTSSMAGKVLVMWVPGSGSSVDSVYLITRVISSTQIAINLNTGGTPDPITKHPTAPARSGVCYRVVDMVTGANAATLNTTFGSYLTFELNAALINPGQGNINGISQIQIATANENSSFINSNPNYQGITMAVSGTGTWDGTQVAISGASNTNPITITTTAPHGFSTGDIVDITGVLGNYSANGNWSINVTGSNTFTLVGPFQGNGIGTYTANTGTATRGFLNDGYQGIAYADINGGGAYTAGQTAVNMIGDPTFLITHLREQDLFQSNLRLAIYFEIPQRLYPQGNDLHPVAMLLETYNSGSLYTSSTTASYGGGWFMRSHSSDSGSNSNTVGIRLYRTLVKAMRGDGTPDVFGQNLTDFRIGFNTVGGTVPASEAILCLPGVANQFCLGRVKLRTVRFTGTHVPAYHRIGTNGEFIQIQNGICWPWDNTIQPQQLLFYGA